MRAFRIDPVEKKVEEIEIHNTGDIAEAIGFDTIISDEIGPNADHLYLDEDCFIRGAEGRFQIDKIAPVAGFGVVAGTHDGPDELSDVSQTQVELEARITYL